MASGHKFHQLDTYSGNRVHVAGSFAPDSGNDPTDVKGTGFTVAWTSTGLYTITFNDLYNDLESFQVSLQLASGDDKIVQSGTYTAASKTMTVRVWDIGAAAVADITANANNRINFTAVFKNTGV